MSGFFISVSATAVTAYQDGTALFSNLDSVFSHVSIVLNLFRHYGANVKEDKTVETELARSLGKDNFRRLFTVLTNG